MSDKKYYDLNDLYEDIENLQVELQSLRAWKEKARPWIEAHCEETGEALAMRGEFKEDGFMTKELFDDVTRELEENHKELTELLKEGE